ncbi:hypothetical protein HPB48_026293 [Haemaphysalis longicornis]|uniref:Uncharacterized protein n=1 Tax=Haemaphysalis longicornis TaxID=44386 RepID=A0A9J6HAF8_HAELO|nr:hypothetical protein HPB48_026293 [Haemaphysalis longicornis]
MKDGPLSIMQFLTGGEELHMCASGHHPDTALKNILKPAVNTLLKNYVACRIHSVMTKSLHISKKVANATVNFASGHFSKYKASFSNG